MSLARGDRLLVRRERRDRRDRAEDLFGEQVCAVRNVRQHRRLVEVAGAVDPRAAGQDARALGDRVVDQLGDLGALRLVDQRPDLDAVLGPAPDLQRADLRGQLVGERLGDRLVHVEAVGARARLAAVAHLGQQRALDRGIQIGVLEDQERRVAAQLHRDLEHLLGRLLDQLLADRRRARERHLAHARVLDQRRHDLPRRRGGDDVQHAVRQPGLLEDLRQREHRQRRLLGRLDHAGAAGRQRGPDLARAHRQREVPRA